MQRRSVSRPGEHHLLSGHAHGRMRRMRHVRFIPNELGEETLRRLARGELQARLSEVWNVLGDLELDIGVTEPLRLTCGNPVRHALEPLCELAQWTASNRTNRLSSVMGTSALGRSSHLYHRWHGAFDCVLILGERDSTIGVSRHAESFRVTILETDDQPQLDDQSALLTREELLSLPAMLWDDLDGLLKLIGIELDEKEQGRWAKMRLEVA
jgi:hypothetical protein